MTGAESYVCIYNIFLYMHGDRPILLSIKLDCRQLPRL